MTSTAAPIDWLRSLGSALDDFCTLQSKNLIERRQRDLLNQRSVKKVTGTARKIKTISTSSKIEQSAQKNINIINNRKSFDLSTPLKTKDKSPSSAVIEFSLEQTPSQNKVEPSPLSLETPSVKSLITQTPFTESRVKRTAATKANKYIDIVTRRLAEVPANGSTPKSMKIAGKLILDKSPKSRSQILLSSVKQKIVASEPENIPEVLISVSNPIPSTPATVRKRNRTAKIHEIFNTSLMSLASAATSDTKVETQIRIVASPPTSGHILSPSNVSVAPSTISKASSSKLNQMINETDVLALKMKTQLSPAENVTTNVSPLKRSTRTSPAKKPKSQKVSPARKTTPKVSPVKKTPKASPLKQTIPTDIGSTKVVATPLVPMTPKVQNPSLEVEFVAPRSVLRTSKRPRKQMDCSDAFNSTPVQKKAQLTFIDVPVPVVYVNNATNIKITSATPVRPEAPSSTPLPTVQTANRISISSAAVPSIIVPSTGNVEEQNEASSNDDFYGINNKKTPLRVQPMRTPTRSKAIIPSLSDYSAATKIAVIEVAKNSQIINQQHKPATPKVEPWTTRFMQKEQQQQSTTKPAMTQFAVKPIDTSKISGYQANSSISASIPVTQVPIVPKFPLNLANISNMTTRTIPAPLPQQPVVIPESPLSRAKRIDSENTAREEKLKNEMTSKVDKMKQAIGELRSSGGEQIEPETSIQKPNIHSTSIKITAEVPASSTSSTTSKLPVKPKSTILPSPKVPSRLAEAFSGIDSELPPIDIGLVDDEKILRDLLSGEKSSVAVVSSKEKEREKEKITRPAVKTTTIPLSNTATPSTQLHRTAVMNSAAARKVNPLTIDTTVVQKIPTTPKPTRTIVTNAPAVPTTPIPNSSPILPEIHSDEDDEIDKQKGLNQTERENRPTWAMTPNLTVALNAQRSKRAEDVFGKVQPIKLEGKREKVSKSFKYFELE